jgi:hypothetical protein
MLNRQTVIVAVVGLLSSAIHADTIHVDAANCPGPGDGSVGEPYCSIQTAIDNAVDTDEIVVAPGTYVESIDLLGRAITLRSSDGPELTTIDGTGFFHVVRCVNGEGPDTVLDGFTITGGNANGPFPDNLGGGMFNDASSPTVTNCTFSGNSTTAGGGGLFSFNGSPTVIDCTFAFNSAANGNAIGFDFGPSEMSVANCILWNRGDEIWINDGSTITVAYSDVQGSWPGIGNIDADPLFVAAPPSNCCAVHGGPGCDDVDCTVAVCTVEPLCCQAGWEAFCVDLAADLCAVCPTDYRLQPGSPCIDAGDNTLVPVGIDTDLDGNPRFLEIPETPDTGNGTLPIVDMGAYESLGGGCLAVISQEVVCHADGATFTVNIEGLNACTGGTTEVTFTASGGAVGDELCFTTIVSDGGFCCSTEICVTTPDCTPVAKPSDLDGDGIVGMVDFLALLAAWGTCSDCSTPQACPADFDGDCTVGILDLLILLGNWTA